MRGTKILIFIVAVFMYVDSFAQPVYQTISAGTWSVPATWLGGIIPPNPLLFGDTIIISHAIVYDVNQAVTGVMIIDSLASISGPNDLLIGKGSINQGVLLNNGSITVNYLACEPDDCIMPYAPVDPFPVINNYGQITVTTKFLVGQSCGSGSLYNFPGGTVTATDMEIHSYTCNQDSMFITNALELDGGLIDCCGYVETPLVEAQQNGPLSLPGTSVCQTYCSGPLTAAGGSPPIIDIGGSLVTSPDIYTNPFPTEGLFDTLTVFCQSTLPVELLSFELTLLTRNKIDIVWSTASENNNNYFTVERSVDGKRWELVAYVDGVGNSQSLNIYSLIDDSPYLGVSYYRLSQTDFDGSKEFFKVKSVENNATENGFIGYPNPATFHLYLQGNEKDLKNISVYTTMGQNLTSNVVVKSVSARQIMVDVTELSPGLYYIQGGENTFKFIKK